MKQLKPNLFIVGAPKCGTSSVYHYLNQFPEVFMSRDKEPHFLAFNGEKNFVSVFGDQNSYDTLRKHPFPVTDEKKYQKLFKSNGNFKYIGEASTLYLYSKLASQKIYHEYDAPDLRIIMILRDPVERAYSQFLHHVREDLESTDDFQRAFKDEDARINNGPFWHYRKVGLYAEQVNRYYRQFDNSKILVLKFEDFKTDFDKIKQTISSFLNLQPIRKTETSEMRYNATGYPVNKFVQKILTTLASVPFKSTLKNILPSGLINTYRGVRQKNLFKPDLDTEIKKELYAFFKEDIRQLEEITGMNFQEWKVEAEQ